MNTNETFLNLIPLSHIESGKLVFSWWDNLHKNTMIVTMIENLILIIFLYGLIKLLEEYFLQKNEIDKSSLDSDTKQSKGSKNRFNESLSSKYSFIPKVLILFGLVGMCIEIYLSIMILNTLILSMVLSCVFVIINKMIEVQLSKRLRFIS